ncbi:MAG: hypothetical protein L3J83_04990 [Proteobacteria bacterium]|nr:hypothetical protein [Pseudomonadota bacterium]
MNQLIKHGKYIIVLVFFIFLCIIDAYPQNIYQPFKKIQYVYDDTRNFVEEIHFFDEQSKELIKTFNLKENNPYKGLPFPIVKDVFLTFDLSGVKLNEIKLGKGKLHTLKGLPDDFELKNGGATSFSGVYERNPDYTIVAYYFNAGIAEEVVAYSTIIYVFNKKGEIIKEIVDLEAPLGDQVITKNGKYLAIGYGATTDANFKILSNDGCLIYNLTNENVIDQKAPEGYSWSSPMVYGDLVVIVHESTTKRYYFVFDFNKNKRFSKVYDKSKLNKGQLKEIIEEGFVFEVGERGSGIYKVDKYINDFKWEAIK